MCAKDKHLRIPVYCLFGIFLGFVFVLSSERTKNTTVSDSV